MKRSAYCIFADDVRQETGNKTSIMGMYTRSLNIEVFPAIIPRFWICTFLQTPFTSRFETVSIRIKLNDTLVSEEFLPKEFIDGFWADTDNALSRGEIAKDDMVTLGINAMISPLKVDEASVLTVRVEVDNEQIDVGKIRILGPD